MLLSRVPSMAIDEIREQWRQFADELDNFQEIARHLTPASGEVPSLDGIDIAGFSLPLNQVVGGDHVIYLDFEKRFDLEGRIRAAGDLGLEQVVDNLERLKQRAGILVADVSGHRMTDALICGMLHQAFLVGANYELDQFGQITTKLFEHINTRFYRTTAINKYFTMIYGEITESGTFHFISAGHRPPAIFSREFGRLAPIRSDHLVSFPPVGMMPSDADELPEPSSYGYKQAYQVNELALLSAGDILLLYTDGLTDHAEATFFPDRLEAVLRECGDESASEISRKLRLAVEEAAPQEDDVSVVVIKRLPA